MTRKTAILKDSLFLEHEPGYNHVECPDRLAVIYNELAKEEIAQKFLFPGFRAATQEELALNHTEAHVKRVAATAGSPFEVLDPDTHTSAKSYDAACLAAGAVISGLELVASGEADNVAALVRPPGHHAEADHTSGFCLFNNIAVGAHYGLKNLGMERIFIMDWDLHHGNGTQHSFYDTDQVLYSSTHQYPYFPGSGGLEETGSGAGEGYTVNVPLTGGQNDEAFARIFNELLVPVARQYKPDCIMVSAGYDTYVADPLGTMAVTAEGYSYMTKVLVELAEELCGGKLVLVLEGGYNFQGLKDGMLATLHEMAGIETLSPDTLKRLRETEFPVPPLEQAKATTKKFWTF